MPSKRRHSNGPGFTEINHLKDNIFAPLKVNQGIQPSEFIRKLQEAMFPIRYNLRRSKGRMEEALSKIEDLEQMSNTLQAKDGHHLSYCHGARAMAVCADMTSGLRLKERKAGDHITEKTSRGPTTKIGSNGR